MNNITIIIYYIYVIIVIILSGYAVFALDHSGWWFLLTVYFISISPKIDNHEK
jgi:hypothetical protein